MKTEAEKQLANLVSMPTISADTTANDMALDYLEDYFSRRGMFVRRDRFVKGHGTLLASTRKDNLYTPKVLLSAHIDVVPADEALFTLRSDGDKLIGRGVYDMKFSIAGYQQIVDELYRKGSLADYDFGIAIVTDEETTDRGVHGLTAAGLKPQVCVLPDSTAPGWAIETIAKGYWRFDLIAQGRTAHGGRPWEGESASFKLLQALHELKGHFTDQNIKTDSLNIGQIHGGDANNKVPAEMVAGLDIRYLTNKNLAEKKKLVHGICQKYNLNYREYAIAAPVVTDTELPLIKAYRDSVKQVTGKQPEPFISCAGSDAPYFAEAGISCIISCCEGGGHHTEQEWISRKSFLQFVPIIHHYLNLTCKAHSSAPAVSTKVEKV